MTVNVSSSSTLSEKTPNQRCVQFRGCVKVRCKSTFSVPIRNPESVEFNKKGLYTTVDCRRSKLIELNEFIERGSNSRNRSHYIKVEPQTSELTFCVLVTEVHQECITVPHLSTRFQTMRILGLISGSRQRTVNTLEPTREIKKIGVTFASLLKIVN